MTALEPCSSCRRHIRRGTRRCPFCARLSVGIALAVSIAIAPAIARADAAVESTTADSGEEAFGAADAAPNSPEERERNVVPLYGVPPDRSRGCGGCATTTPRSNEPVALVGAALALAALRRRR